MAAFKASARSLDQGIGAVLNGLHDLDLTERTLIICTTDHGLAFPSAKATLYDRGTGVMLLMRGPGGFTGGKVFDAMVSHLDIYPTLCDIAGAERPDFLQGTSLLPLVTDQTDRIHDEIFTEVTFHAAYEPTRAIRTERWKYIRRFDDNRHPVLSNADDSASKEILVEAGWADRDRRYRAALRLDPRPERGPQPGRGARPRERGRGTARAAHHLDDGRPRTRWSTGRFRCHPGPSSTNRARSPRTTRCRRARRPSPGYPLSVASLEVPWE